jgi:N6-adenosine-specific RNA methylase IME4
LLVCVRGSFPKQNNTLHDSVISIERTDEHSEKPEYFRTLIEDMYPKSKKIELFARKQVDGWDVWGNEL